MTLEEIYVTYEELKKEGYKKESLFCATCKMFINDELSIDDLKSALKVLGYKLSDELLKMDKEQQKALINDYIIGFAEEYDLKEFK
ncbi:MAG: hypothetical protein J6Y28_08890 [Acholeplasmatales bacterium]|nr:hypothetical protein [Acholeplasmatales bacterium]